MSKEFDVAQSMANEGDPEADRHLAENFGMTLRQVRDFDPQTLDVTRACKFLGLPPKRFDQLAAQPEARGRWVESVARERKDLIETFPQAGEELKGMLEAIRKFALRKCLKPDGPALVEGGLTGTNKSKFKDRRRLIVGSGAIAAILFVGVAVLVMMSARGRPEQQAKSSAAVGPQAVPASLPVAASEAPTAVATASLPPAPQPVAVTPRPAEPFRVNSVWKGDDPPKELRVTVRDGAMWTGVLKIGEKIERVVSGAIEGGKLQWLSKDVRAVRGGVGGDNQGTFGSDKDGDKIDFVWQDSKGVSGRFTLRLSTPSSKFQLNTVWKGDQRVLTITERKDDKFTATFKIGTKYERIVTGTIEDGKIRWLGKDVRAIIGETKGGNYNGTFRSDTDGDKIDFVWLDGKGESGSFVLSLSKEAVVKPVPAPPRLEDIIGVWDSDFGKVTLENTKPGVISGYWIQDLNKKGLITSGTFTPGARTLTFAITQPWNNQKGSATFTLSADSTKLDGTWKHSSGNGKWQMTRVAK